ncbi:MAG: type IIL restriction-modification enzyme MmeI [Burkholderiaceae bacterium]
MGKLHDTLKASGYAGHALEVLLVRLLFCLFADDTGIFQPAQAFRAWVEERTGEDGADLARPAARPTLPGAEHIRRQTQCRAR